jgi:DNA-binding transcriptional ArsR family regulator
MQTGSIITSKHELLARCAKAMAHPVRAYILELLSEQSCCFSGDLAEHLPIARSTLSQHLKELKNAGLIQGNIEYPKIRYCINKENWEKAQLLFSEFLKLPTKTKQ